MKPKSFLDLCEELDAADAEIAALRAKLAARGVSSNEDSPGDEVDPADDTPTKKKTKKKAKDTGALDQEFPEGDDPQDRENPAPPKKNNDESPKDGYRAQVDATVAAIVHADARRRGVRPRAMMSIGSG